MTEGTLAASDIRAEARRLLDAERARRPIGPPSARHPGLTIADAYAIQSEGIELRRHAGARRVGRKVGLTSQAMQEMLGVHQPDYGVVLDTMVLDAADGIDAARLIAPRVEAEIGFVLARPVGSPQTTVDDVLAATSHVRPALEIIDSRVADWQIAIADTIADNASSGLVILGPEMPIDQIDVVAEHVTVTVGDASVQGSGEAVLGHPAEAVAWLARTLAQHGERLEAGEWVIPGAVAAALPFAAGDAVTASYSTLGTLEVDVR
jgi:2-keto-4-pentenoate hydratase